MPPPEVAAMLDRFFLSIPVPSLDEWDYHCSLNRFEIDWTDLLMGADWCDEYEILPSLAKFIRHLHKSRFMYWVLPTGSRRYGTPKPDSDWDIVLFGYELDVEYLARLADDTIVPYRIPHSRGLTATYRFGPLNVILVLEFNQWQAWVIGTRNLVNRKPVTRVQAIEEFQHQFLEA